MSKAAYMREYRKRKGEKHRAYERDYLARNKGRINAQRKNRREAESESERESRLSAKRESSREYYSKNKETILAKLQKYNRENPGKRSATRAKSQKKNMPKILAKTRQRRIADKNFAIKSRLRTRMRNAIVAVKGAKKSAPTEALVGCSIEFLKGYIEARFKDGMSWDNFGKWHIDHIIPCAEFDLIDPNQQKMCFRYSNLQPLWAAENIRKSDKVPANHQLEII